MKIKSFDCPKSIEDYEKKYLEHQTIGCRVIHPIEPANQGLLYCRLLDFSTMGWGHVVKHHMHNMPSRVNMMKHDTVTTIHLRTTPLCDTNGRTQVIYANVCAHRHA